MFCFPTQLSSIDLFLNIYHIFSKPEQSACWVVSTSDWIMRSWVWIPLEMEFSPWLYGTSLHRAYHCYSFTSSKLDNGERNVKHEIIIIIWALMKSHYLSSAEKSLFELCWKVIIWALLKSHYLSSAEKSLFELCWKVYPTCFAQSDQDHHHSLPEFTETVEVIGKIWRPWSVFIDTQVEIGCHCWHVEWIHQGPVVQSIVTG